MKKTDDSEMILVESGDVPVLRFRALDETGLVEHCFSTRLGGVSGGCYSSMDLSFTRGDDPEKVAENYRRIGKTLNTDPHNMSAAYQTHTVNIKRLRTDDRGYGVTSAKPYRDIDGLVTDVPGLMLVTYHADCVPIYVLDPVHPAAGLAHAGWRGTAGKMAKHITAAMTENFGSRPEDMICCIGPCICVDCYEVGAEVAERFETGVRAGTNGRYYLDLREVSRVTLAESGILPENIHVTDLCTRCRNDLFFSHRAMGEKRGSCAAFLGLKKSRQEL